ncbi:MAG TPA: hypothetical protein ENF22_06240 [Chloroflexi bacterium]|nr:hypothetical protein [Chloroflexota bacterium]
MKEYFTKRRKIIVFAVAVMAVTMIPYLVGFAQQGDEWRYTGFVIGVEDGNSYIAKMVSGASGNWLFRSPHSAVEQQGVIAYLPYIILGKLASGPAQHEQMVVLYHLARLVFGFFAILATYDFISIYIKKSNLRWWALVLISLGGGLGWILVAISQKGFFGSLPLEFISPESFGFLGIFGFPHLAAARALFLWGLTVFLKMEKGYLAGFLWLIMGFFQPMIVVIAWVIIGIFAVSVYLARLINSNKHFGFSKRNVEHLFRKVVQAVAVSGPIVIYTAYIFLTDPYFKAWTVQNQFPSPHFIHYFVAYGMVLPFAIAGLRKLFQDKMQESLLLSGWLIISPFLIYAPVITQRRLAEGIWAVLIIGMIGNYTDKEKIPTLVKGLLLLLLPSTLFIFLGSILTTANPSVPIFRKVDEVRAYEFIAAAADKDAVVLSSFEIGNNLPAWAPVRVVMGHGPETIGLAEIIAEVSAYFNQESITGDCEVLFKDFKAAYLFWGPEEMKNWNANPEENNCLIRIFNNGDYSIYEINYREKQ